jgi:hypothetical protein
MLTTESAKINKDILNFIDPGRKPNVGTKVEESAVA